MRPLLHCCVLLGALALLGACRERPQGPPPGISSLVAPGAHAPLRIALVPFYAADGIARSAAGIDQALQSALREHGRHLLVAIPTAVRDELMPDDPLAASHLSSADLIAVRRRTGCDAALIGRIEQYQPYDPIRLGLTLYLVSCHDATVLWSATALLDGSRNDVQADIERWWRHAGGDATDGVNTWRQTLQSPSQFQRYAAWRLVQTLTPPPDAPAATHAKTALR